MADFQTQVEGITQLTVGTTPTTSELSQFLADGVKDVTDKIVGMRPEIAPMFAVQTIVSDNNGSDLGGAMVLGVVRENGTPGEFVTAERIGPDQRYLINDSSSLNYRSKFHPAFYEIEGLVHVHPFPSTSGDRAFIHHITYTSAAYDDDSINNFPDQYERLVVLYASLKSIEANMGVMTAPAALSIDIAVPIAPTAPSFDSDDASLQNAVDSFTKTLSGMPPMYNGNNTPMGLDTLKEFATFSTFVKEAPTLFDVPQPILHPTASLAFDGPISTALDYTDTGINKLLQKIQVLTPPTYDAPVFALTPWTFNTKPDFTGVAKPSATALVAYHADYAGLESELPTPWNPGSDIADGDDATGNDTIDLNETAGQQLNWSTFNAALADDDFEKATAELTKITQMVTLRDSQFTKQMEIYKEKVTRVADKVSNVTDKEWAMNIAKFNADLQQYTTDVGNIFTQWTHDMNLESQKYTNENTQGLSKFGQDMTNALNNYNLEKAKYDAEVAAQTKDVDYAFQLATKNAELEDNLEIQNSVNAAKKEVDQYQADIKKYEVSISRYNSDVSSSIEAYKTDLQRELDIWKTTQQNYLGKFKDDISEAQKIYEAKNVVYQAEIQRDMAELTRSSEAAVQKMELSTNVDLTNKAQKLQSDTQKYTAEIDLYVSKVQEYKEEVATKTQEFSSALQSDQLDYTWLSEQYARIKMEYNEAFGVGAPREGAPA